MTSCGRRGRSLVVVAGVGLLTAALAGAAGAASGGTTSRVSVSSTGQQADAASFSYNPAISADGRYVVFLSHASNLVAGDTNGAGDVFVRNRQSAVTRRVSVGPDARQGNGGVLNASMSPNARFILFASSASNLVPGDTNGWIDVFVRDRRAGLTERVSLSSDSGQGNEHSGLFSTSALSGDGRFVAFESSASSLVSGDTNDSRDVFVRDRQAGVTRRVSVGPDARQASGDSSEASISGDGRYVAFVSSASDLVAGDTNGVTDVFVRDRWSRVTRRVSAGPSGGQSDGASDQPSISADGRFVTFSSWASNLVAGDTNSWADVFVRDRWTGLTQRVSVGPDALQADGGSNQPVISGNGRYIAFGSSASNLVAGDTNELSDIFVRDQKAGVTRRFSISTGGEQTLPSPFYLGSSSSPAISLDGRHVAFTSSASNLVPDDTNDDYDIFVRDESRGAT